MDKPAQSDLDKRIQAIAILRGIERAIASLQPYHDVAVSQADALTDALALLEQTGVNLEPFRLPQDAFITTWDDHNYLDRNVTYGRVTAVIDYLSIWAAVLELADEIKREPARMIGFPAPQRRAE